MALPFLPEGDIEPIFERLERHNTYFMMKVASLYFEVCYPQQNALSVEKSKAKTGKIRHVSQDIRHLHEIP